MVFAGRRSQDRKALKQALTEQEILGVSKIMDDLTEFEEVLNVASANQGPWHLAVDF